MASPAGNENLFLNSSSPNHYSSGPAEEVEILLADALKIDQLDPAVANIISANQDAFFQTFQRRVEMIKSRSQAFQDCHVTVFDKVLLELTKNGNDLTGAASITYFCEEYLGVPASASSVQKDIFLTNSLVASTSLARGLASTPPASQRGSVPAKMAGSKSPEKKPFQTLNEHQSLQFATLAAQVDRAAVRLWGLYETAKQEFFAITNTTVSEKQKAAKFLRDTAENTLDHLRGKQADERLIEELNKTLEVAKHTAMTLHGGKRRKFDHPGDGSFPNQADWPETVGRVQEAGKKQRYSRVDDDRSHEGNAGQGRDWDHNGTPRGASGRNGEHEQFLPPDQSYRTDRNHPKRKSKQSGKGHSGIPFGYSRDVDSYQPGQN